MLDEMKNKESDHAPGDEAGLDTSSPDNDQTPAMMKGVDEEIEKQADNEGEVAAHVEDKTSKPNESKASLGSHVSFGEVHVHSHRMTLGSNPSATGVPVELAWEENSSEHMKIDEFEEHHQVHRIAAKERRKIAEAHHSRDSITMVEEDSERIKKAIQESRTSDAAAKSRCCAIL